jgi:hypothetical protein
MGGAVGEVHGAKLVGMLQRAVARSPDAVLLLLETGGVRLHEANAGLIAVSEVMRAVLDTRAAGIPVIALVGGSNGCFGGMGIVARCTNASSCPRKAGWRCPARKSSRPPAASRNSTRATARWSGALTHRRQAPLPARRCGQAIVAELADRHRPAWAPHRRARLFPERRSAGTAAIGDRDRHHRAHADRRRDRAGAGHRHPRHRPRSPGRPIVILVDTPASACAGATKCWASTATWPTWANAFELARRRGAPHGRAGVRPGAVGRLHYQRADGRRLLRPARRHHPRDGPAGDGAHHQGAVGKLEALAVDNPVFAPGPENYAHGRRGCGIWRGDLAQACWNRHCPCRHRRPPRRARFRARRPQAGALAARGGTVQGPMYRRHDLVWLTPQGWETALRGLDGAPRELAHDWRMRGLPAVVRRQNRARPPPCSAWAFRPRRTRTAARKCASASLPSAVMLRSSPGAGAGRCRRAGRLAAGPGQPAHRVARRRRGLPRVRLARDADPDRRPLSWRRLRCRPAAAPLDGAQLDAGLALVARHAQSLPLDGEIEFPSGMRCPGRSGWAWMPQCAAAPIACWPSTWMPWRCCGATSCSASSVRSGAHG